VIKDAEKDKVCGVYDEERESMQGFGGGNLKERDRLKDLGADGRIILKYTLKRVEWRGADYFFSEW
jgi:hypothetical protein